MSIKCSSFTTRNFLFAGINKELSNVDKSAQDMLISSGANVTNKMSGLNQLAYRYLDTSDKMFEEAAMLREHAQTELRPQLKLLSMEGKSA